MPPKRYVVRAYVTLTEVEDGRRAPPPSDDEDGGPPPDADREARRLRRQAARELRRQLRQQQQQQQQQPVQQQPPMQQQQPPLQQQPQQQPQQQQANAPARLVVLGDPPGRALEELRLQARLPPNTTATRLVTRLSRIVSSMASLLLTYSNVSICC